MGAPLGKKRGRRGGFTEINVTPFVDVMLVLLVVFMVTAPLLTTGLKIDLPEVEAAATPVKDSRLLVTVTKEGRVLLGEKDITGKVPEALRESVRVQTEQQLYIRADKDARYGSLDELERELPKLATYLGHRHVADTYWYLEAVPELLALVTERATRPPEPLR